MNTLDSPIEALAFHNLSFFVSALACNIWAWLAAATAAASFFWRIKSDASPSTAPSRACVAENNAAKETVAAPSLTPLSVKFTARYGDVELERNACWEAAASAVAVDTITDDDCGGFFGGEGWWCDEPVVACYETTVATKKASLKVSSVADSADADHDLYWNAILRMRNGDSIGQCHDTTRVLDGNVVKLWDRYSGGGIARGR